jgi:hypothetical protein
MPPEQGRDLAAGRCRRHDVVDEQYVTGLDPAP